MDVVSLYPPRTDHPPRALPMKDVGLAVHTVGEDDAIAAQIRKEKADAGEWYARYYRTAEFYPHFVGGHDGRLFRIAAAELHVPHVGCTEAQRQQFLSGRWEQTFRLYGGEERAASAHVVDLWKRRWGRRWRSPQHLFPGPSPNDAYVGLELTPIFPGCGYEPMASDLRYTRAQHDAVATLAVGLARAYGWPLPELPANRLLGHEDLNPMDRPGWDPGGLRDRPWLDWTYIWARVHDLALPDKETP